jgi:hypothetical protein
MARKLWTPLVLLSILGCNEDQPNTFLSMYIFGILEDIAYQ